MKLIVSGNSIKDIKDQIVESALEFMKQEAVSTSQSVTASASQPATSGPEIVITPEVVAVEQVAPLPVASAPPPAPPRVSEAKSKAPPAPKAKKPVALVETPPRELVTKDQAIGLLNDVCTDFGMDRARSCLARFKVSRFSELKEEQHQAFAEYCQDVLAKKPV